MYNFLLTLLIFSSMEVVSKPLMAFTDPFVLTFYRFLVGCAVLFAYIFIRGEGKMLLQLPRKTLKSLIILGVLNGFFSMSMLQLAVKMGNAATAAVVFCSNPLFVYLIMVLLGEEKFSKKRSSGLIIGISGIVFIMFNKGFLLSMGAIAALLASISFAVYQVWNKKAVHGISPYIANSVAFGSSLPAYLIFFAATGTDLTLPEQFFQTEMIWRFIYLSLIVSALGYISFIKTIQKLSAVSGSLIFLLKPAVATIFAIWLLNENPGWNFYAGLFLSISGSLLAVDFNKLKSFLRKT